MHKTLYLILVIISLLFWQCKNSNNDIEQLENKNIVKDSTLVSTNKVEIIDSLENSFNPEIFNVLIDSFVPQITNNTNPFSFNLETFQNGDTTINWRGLQPNKANLIRRYDYKNDDYFLHVIIIESNYNNSNDVDTIFENLRTLAKGSGAEDGTPGLTYTNDYLIKSNQKIFWLHSGCYYAYPNFIKLSKLFESSIKDVVKLDSIKCKCGGAYIE